METYLPTRFTGVDKTVERDNLIRVSTKEQLAKLKPAFVKPHEQLLLMEEDLFVTVNGTSSRSNIPMKPQCQESERNPKVMFAGFSTVSGKQIPVSSAMISKKMSIFENGTVNDIKAAPRAFGNRTNIFDDIDREFDFRSRPLHL